MLKEANDFRDESQALFDLLEPLSEQDLETPTLFQQWTLNDILAHLHFFNRLADLSLKDEPQFSRIYDEFKTLRDNGETMVSAVDKLLDGLSGRTLLNEWREFFVSMAADWVNADPKQRVQWAGPSMSVRSSISARLMETWAHGQAVYDVLGVERVEQYRIKSIAVMGVNTFGWTFKNRGLEIPSEPPYLRLTAPSGAIWEWNNVSEDNFISGSAAEFCQVVTQVRNIADTKLNVQGETATRWMALAQCFAGAPVDPPAPGARYRVTRS